jgi:hypothetical protein
VDGSSTTRADFDHSEIQKRDQHNRWNYDCHNSQITTYQKHKDREECAGTNDENG